MKVPFYGHTRQYHNVQKDIDAHIQKVLDSGEYVHGPMNKQFEKEFAAFSGTRFSIPCGNGTDALWLSLMAMGIGKGDEVITNANTFFATAEAIWIAGATAVLVDCCPKTKTICPEKIEKAITPKTRCIIPVHLYGQCADMVRIRKIADQHGLKILEDNAQAIDAAGDTFKIGELSDAVATSFIIQKNLGCFGDGGAIVTNDEEINRRTKLLRAHGSPARNVHSFGFNSRLDDIQAGVLSVKLKHIHEWNNQRIQWAKRYTEGLKNVTCVDLPYAKPGYRHVWHLYVIETKRPQDRDPMLKWLNEQGVDAKTHYSIAIHQQEGYPWGKDARIVGPLTNAEANAACCISLPMFPELTKEEVDYTIGKVLEWEKLHPESCSKAPGAARAGICCEDK
ncbi:MAG: DegT/DnrJ/EryC1/StrS family aminotransferase [Kiritimatiellae bacterium]|nr:DegT/DnrJ/EryC1/StrS family aminotransferase [Kiritimatiellia bacterium]